MKSAVFYCQNSIKISTYIIDGAACNTGYSEKVNQAPEKGWTIKISTENAVESSLICNNVFKVISYLHLHMF